MTEMYSDITLREVGKISSKWIAVETYNEAQQHITGAGIKLRRFSSPTCDLGYRQHEYKKWAFLKDSADKSTTNSSSCKQL
jgi:hypothetical protein